MTSAYFNLDSVLVGIVYKDLHELVKSNSSTYEAPGKSRYFKKRGLLVSLLLVGIFDYVKFIPTIILFPLFWYACKLATLSACIAKCFT